MLEQEQLAERQAQLSKALSAAYLNHQISELEDKVRRLPTSQAQGQAPAQIGEATVGNKDKAVAVETLKPIRRIDDDHSVGRGGARRFEDDERHLGSDDENENEDWKVAVVDVSALMWAPKATRSLVARGFEVIVPLNGIQTLDLLKKGNSPSAQAARAATRYIEHASRQHKLLSIDPSITVQLGTNYKRGVGLRMQHETEHRQADELSSLPLMPGEEGPPKWVQAVLGCAAYFMDINKAELNNSFHHGDIEMPPALYVASPPIEILIAEDPTGVGPQTREMREQAERNGSYHERGEGVVVLEEAERFEIGIEILRDDDDEILGMRRFGGRGRGRGRAPGNSGGGGHGNGHTNGGNRPQGKPRRKEEEKQPEVKVLLKRPQPQPQARPQPQVDSNGLGLSTSAIEDSPSSIVRSLLFSDVAIPPPLGLAPVVNTTTTTAPATSHPMAKSNSINSQLSAEISPPVPVQRRLPAERKSSPPSKFVPLSRETHPVRRRADDVSSDSSRSQGGRNAYGASRGRGRGGRGGRGGGGAGTRGEGGSRRKKERERDSEFKNGNFTLLQRPQPPAPPAPAPASAAAAPGPTTILARPASSRPAGKPSAPAPAPNVSHPPVRSILQRPPRPTANGSSNANSNGAPARPFPPARDVQTSWRAKAGPPPVRPQVNQVVSSIPAANLSRSPGLSANAPAFEFDEAMLKPGYGSALPSIPSQQAHHANGNGHGSFQTNGHAHGRGRGRGGFGNGNGGHGAFHRPPPSHAFGHVNGHGQYDTTQPRAPGTTQWQPAAEAVRPVLLQRPK